MAFFFATMRSRLFGLGRRAPPASTDGDALDLLAARCEQEMRAGRFDAAWALVRAFSAEALPENRRGHYAALAGHVALAASGDPAAAIVHFERAFAAGCSDRRLLINALLPYWEAGDLERTAWIEARLAEEHADDAEARFTLSFVALARGDYARGFALAEARYELAEAAHSISPWLLGRPRWQGEALTGRRLLVHAEQGLGDAIMMARYLPQLVAQCGKVIVDCRPPAVALLAENFPACEFVVGEIGRPITQPFDLWTGLMSLPQHRATTADSVPAGAGYLQVPREAAAYWRERIAELAPQRPRIGLAWSGNPAHPANRRRSLPFDRLCAFLPRCASFFALQTDVPAERPPQLIDLSSELITLADTAALIDEMDLIISSDTSIPHLAGSLGKETWLLIPPRWEWRWGMSGERTPWYDAVRVLRQPTVGDWDGLLAEVFGERLPDWLARRSR